MATTSPSASFLLRCRHKLEEWAVRGVMWLVPQLRRQQVLALAKSAGSLAYWADCRGRNTAIENLSLAFPEKPSSWHRNIARRSYQNFARTFLDLFWSPNLRHDVWRQLVHGFYPADPQLETSIKGTAALWCTAHFGNFEWLALRQNWQVQPITIVAQDFKNPHLTELFSRLRATAGATMISSEGSMIKLFKALKKNQPTAFLCDLTVKPTEPATIIRCFGRLTCVTIIHSALATRTGAPIVPMLAASRPDGTLDVYQWEAISVKEDTSAAEVAQRIWDHFEPIIRQHPEQWMWMYKHWRYEPASDSTNISYPSYANRSGAFEKLLRKMG